MQKHGLKINQCYKMVSHTDTVVLSMLVALEWIRRQELK